MAVGRSEAVVKHSPVASVALLTVSVLVLGAVCALVAFGLAGWPGVEAAFWSTLFCLVPGWLVLLAESLYRLPRDAVYGALLGSFVRLGGVTAGALLVVVYRPEIPRLVLAGCLGVLYLGSLLIETVGQLRRLPLRPAFAGSIAAAKVEN
jgi:hypothetical protein